MRRRMPEHDVRQYLKELDKASRGLPRSERRDLRAQIEEHIRSALDGDRSEARVAEVLDRLGDPQEIVAEQYGGRATPRGMGAQAVAAIVLLLLGGFLAGIGWLVGVVLLWTSRAWTTREKLVGTLLVPGGLATVSFLLLRVGGEACSSGYAVVNGRRVGRVVEHCTGATTTIDRILALALLGFLLLAPIFAAAFLARRARPVAA